MVSLDEFRNRFKNKFGFELTQDFKKIFDYWHNSKEPYYSPYHIDSIKDYSGTMWTEPKYDGSHVMFGNGIYSHSAKPLDVNLMILLAYYYTQHPDVLETIISITSPNGSRKIGMSAELYGKLNSPAGFHKSDSDPLVEIAVFEVYEDGQYLSPPEKYSLLEKLKIPYVKGRLLTYQEALEWSKSPETFEGVVVKDVRECDRDYMKLNLCIGKIKKSKVELTKVKPEKSFTQEMMDEIINEFDKHPEYLDMKPSDVKRKIFEYLAKAHPKMFMEMSRKKAEEFIYNEWKKRRASNN